MNTPYSRPVALDHRAIDTWNRRNKAARDAYHDATKDARGRERRLGDHVTSFAQYDADAGEFVQVHVACACVRCDP